MNIKENNGTPIRVLMVVTHLNRNGLESRIMDIYRNIDRSKIQFDFMIHRNDLGDFGEEIISMGGKIYSMPPFSPKNFLSYIVKLDKFFSEHKEYKIVHVHLNSLSTWALRAAKRNGVPVRIAHSRNSGMERDLKGLFKLISKQFVNLYCNQRFACSQLAGDWLFGEKFSRGDTFKVIPNAFQIDKFKWNPDIRNEVRSNLGVKDGETVYIDVARLSEQKNHLFLIDVFRNIIKKQPGAKLFLIGKGENEEKIRAYIRQNSLEDSVIMLGARADVYDIYQGADLFLFPSKYEGFGTVILEAQVTHLPILAGDTIPHETKLDDCVEFLSIERSAEEWASKALNMLKSSERYDNTSLLQKAGYDISVQYKWLEDYYMRCFNESNHERF